MSLTVAPPTTQRRRGSTLPHMVIKHTSDRDPRYFVSQKTNVAQDVLLPASQHAQSLYPVSPSAPFQRPSTIVLAPPATQHAQQQKASQLTGDSTKSPIVQIAVPWEFSFCGNVTTDANHPRLYLAHQDDMVLQTHRVWFAAETVTIGSSPPSCLRLPRQSTTLPPRPSTSSFLCNSVQSKDLFSAPQGNLPSISLNNAPITPRSATLDGPRSTCIFRLRSKQKKIACGAHRSVAKKIKS
jgi:hypothetical protein